MNNLLYSKTAPPKQSNPLLQKERLFNLLQNKLNEGASITDYYGILRSTHFPKQEDYNPPELAGHVLVGFFLKEGKLAYCAFIWRNFSHQLIIESKTLRPCLKAANQTLKEILPKNFEEEVEFGVSSFQEADFWNNLEECLKDPDSFYWERDRKLDFVTSSLYLNGRYPSRVYGYKREGETTSHLRNFEEAQKRSLEDWQDLIEKEDDVGNIPFLDYFIYQSPFYEWTLTEEEQKKIETNCKYKLVDKYITEDCFENNSEVKDFFEDITKAKITPALLKLIKMDLRSILDKTDVNAKDKLISKWTHCSLPNEQWLHKMVITQLAFRIGTSLSSGMLPTEGREEGLKILCKKISKNCYKEIRHKFYKANKAALNKSHYSKRDFYLTSFLNSFELSVLINDLMVILYDEDDEKWQQEKEAFADNLFATMEKV